MRDREERPLGTDVAANLSVVTARPETGTAGSDPGRSR